MARIPALALFLALAAPAQAATAPACPATALVSETPAAVPTGFTAFINGDTPKAPGGPAAAHALDTIAFSDGPPTEDAWLAPTAGGKGSQRWDFAGSGETIWLSCGYLATSVLLSAPLPTTTRSCKVIYDEATSPPTATGLTCR
jgi:hypothetical protein